jgi:hypothetical protein
VSVGSVNEELMAQDYLLDYLSSDSTLADMVNGFTFRSAWGELRAPYVKIVKLDGTDLQVMGPFRVWADLTYQVKGVVHWDGRGLIDWTDVRAIADRIDVLMQAHEVITSTLELHSFREESYSDETFEDGVLYLHAGGIYRVRAHAF